MANLIKGLTIEIGGDTTKLGKALEDVNKKSRDISSELGEINRLLKMDPGNTDLLAQKQQVLAEAIENTGDKLETLKEAEKQVQEQFERGEASEEQLRALQREIIATEKKLATYERAAKETAETIENLGKESENAGEGLDDTGEEAKDASKKVDDFADAADDAGEASGNLGETLGSVAKTGLAAVAAAAAAAVAGLVAAAESSREYRNEMAKLDTAFTTAGHSSAAAVETYQTLQGVLGETEQAVEAANHLAKLTDNEEDLATWTDICTGVYATFGASLPIEGLTEAANETAKTGALTGGLADALNWAGVSEDEFQASLDACTTEQERQALITETLAGLYGEAAEAYREANAEVIRANEANEAWNASMAEIGGAIEPIITDVKMLGASLLSDLVPGVKQLAESFRGVLSGDASAADGIGEALSGIITGLLQKVTDLAPTLVQVATSLITTLTTSLIEMLPQIVTVGVQLVASIIEGIGLAFPQIVDSIVAMLPILIAQLPIMIEQLLTALMGALPQIIQGCIALLMGLVQAVPQLVEVLLPMIPQIITELTNALAEAWPMLMDAALELAIMLVTDVYPRVIAEIVKALPEILKALIQGVVKIYNSIKAKLEEWDAKLAAWFNGIGQAIKTWASNLWSRIVAWLANLVTKVTDAGAKFLSAVVSFLKELPGKVADWLTKALQKVTTWATNLVTKGKDAAKQLVTAVTDGIKSLPEKMLSVGGDLVEGLWKGIGDKLSWLKSKISSFATSVLDGIKSFFGVNSPSKETAWIGEMLDEGLAKGVLDNSGDPITAMKKVSGGVLDAAANGLNGLALDRQLRFPGAAGTGAAAADGGLAAKLDAILAAIEHGQVLMIDGDQLVGATASRYDATLGQRRALAARGAV